LKFSGFHKNIQIRIALFFVTTLVSNMILPFMAIYFTHYFGQSLAGLMVGIDVLVAAITTLYGGYLSDKWGRKKTMVIAELIRFISLIFVVIFNSPIINSPVCTFIFLTTASAGMGMSGPAAQAMVVDSSDNENRKFIYSMSYWSMNAAMAVGGILGGLLFEHHKFLLFLIVAIVSLISFIVVLLFISETFTATVSHKSNVLKEMVTNYHLVAKDKKFILFTLGALLALSIEFQVRSYLSVRLPQEVKSQVLFSLFGNPISLNGIKLFGILNAENSILVVSCGILAGKILSLLKDKHALIVGIIVNAAAFGVMGFSANVWILFVSMIVASLSELLYWPVTQAMMAELPPEESRSSYLAIFSLVPRGAMLLGAMAISLGAILPSWAMSLVFWGSGAASLLFFLSVFRKEKISHKSNLSKDIMT
jgi:DHA1 family multidrug resistance protein B-like MFS transporter